ncbi:MAG: hypothetical protein RIR00_2110 [Pseudomonadota bacterium]|jgi:hypothetical protein
MLYVFRSPTSVEVMMFGQVAQQLLEIAGKDPQAPRGVITVAQLPDVIARLQRASQANLQIVRTERDVLHRRGDEEEIEADMANISLFQRAIPLIEMLEYALKEKEDVLWGV